ncbi:hypothetical protein HID58_040808 [Brassica napus]|uniref:Uncharacterized protein n=1 Tax=Brassica napus TaxID=3708 RepID=A0ABQ8B942_BRANA|nr:hypothetical protein HID58_040808 [Brassica napus]
MVRTKKMAKRDIAVTSWTHAEGESSRPHLTEEGPEATPPRNDLPSTALLPEITEELELFNTGHEKEPSEESDDQHTSSVREEVQIDKVTATSSDPAPPKPLSAPIRTVPSVSHRSETPDPVTDSFLLLCHEEKDGFVEKAKEQNKQIGSPETSSPDQPNAASGSQALTQNASDSSRVRSRKASTRGTAVEVSPVTKRVEQFFRRSIIAERLVDMMEKDLWGYVEIIAKGSMGTTISSLGNYAKGKAKEVGEGKLSSRSTRMPPLVPSPSIAPTSSNMTGPRRFVVHDLGYVSIPQSLLTLEDLQAVL